jgi:uncharacterized membrane protein YkvA (DUF1232 family)
MLRPARWRYVRSAKVMLQLPTYARLVWGLARDPRTPIGLKLLLGAALTYVVTPVDLIPDFIPLLGTADDLTVLLLVLDLFISNAPAPVRDEHLARAQHGEAQLDQDLARLRDLLGVRFDRIRDTLPQLLERFGGLADADEVKRHLGEWRITRARHTPSKPAQPVEAE